MTLLNISAQNHYGLIIMCALADLWGRDEYLSLKEIAESMDLSAKFLEEIAAKLKKEGLILAKRGAEGGYKLARHPKEIRVREIIQAIEGPVKVVECQAGACPKSRFCSSKNLWLFLEKSLNQTLKNTTLYQVLYKL
jgi:Rrf2 family protein